MADSLKIHYQPISKGSVAPLSTQVQQLTLQRGAFRNITEQILQEEIEHPEPDSSLEKTQTLQEVSSEDEEPQARREKLWKERDEMLQRLSYAQNEILSALDFVSLLLSSHTVAAQSTMSPALRELVPPKSLEGRVAASQPTYASDTERLQAVSDGWKTESFRQAANKLESASLRLNRQTERQSQYWEQIAELQSRGWSISRLPSDRRAIGVHFGFQESATIFRHKGFALLPQADDGKVYLESKLLSTRATVFEVLVVRKGIETGSYRFSGESHHLSPDAGAELSTARDTLFHEELFYEINREARLIANQGVRTQPLAVEADIDPDYQIRIVQGNVASTDTGERSHEDDELAQLIAYCLCFLLIAEHRRLYARRTQPPLPMSLGSTSKSEYAILRPILSQLRHEQHKAEILHICRSFLPSFKSAGLALSIDTVANSGDAASQERDRIEYLRHRLTSSIIMKTNENATVTIKLATYLGSPTYGTNYELSSGRFDFISLETEQVNTSAEVKTALTNLMELVLVAHLKNTVHSMLEKVGKEMSWSLTKPHTGEFLVSSAGQNIARVMVSIHSGCIALHCTQSSHRSGSVREKKAYLWRGNGLQTMPSNQSDSATTQKLDEILLKLVEDFAR